ncbi:MAG: thioredoxin family protein [Solibacillus sp.]
MKTEQQYFEEAKNMKNYMEEMSQLKEYSFAIYENFEVAQDDPFIEKLSNANVHILAITEDWCGDAMLNNPIIRKIAEAANVEIRTVLRDADTDLIDRYLTNGGRAIPIYILLNEAGEVLGQWGPRAPELQQFVMENRAQLPDKEDPNFEEAQKEMYGSFKTKYTEDPQMWTYVYEDFKKTVEAVLPKEYTV